MKKKGQKKTKKRLKLRLNVVFKILLFLVISFCLFLYINNLNIKNIYIEGNNIVKDIEIIEKAQIENYPKLYKLNLKKMKNKVKEIPLIKDVKIKRNPLGKITFEIIEKEILFYYKYNEKYITSDKTEIEDNNLILGYPTLINFTPDTAFAELAKGLSKIDQNIIKMINEIEYSPYKKSDGTLLDETNTYTNARFTLYMSDDNKVIIDTVNIKRLSNYPKIYASLNMDTTKGTLNLDIINDKEDENEETIFFKSFETEQKELEEKLAKEKEEQEKKEEE